MAGFDTTHWSMVLAAGHASSPQSHQALAWLCESYWYPLYGYVRRRVDAHEAQDLTQAFFAELLEKNYLSVARPERGRFRAFLITAFKHFLSKEWDKARALKRGGAGKLLSLDFPEGESRYKQEPASDMTPERFYEHQWALTLLARVVNRLREEQGEAGKQKQFEQLKSFLTGKPADANYDLVAEHLGLSPGAVRTAAHRLRRRYRDLLRAEIAQTVEHVDDVEEEIGDLFEALKS